MAEEYLPDFGAFLCEQSGPDTSFVFASFPITELARVDKDLFSVTATMPHQGSLFTVTVDFSRERLLELVAAMPAELAEQLVVHFSTEFKQPQVVNLPLSVDVCIEATLGEVNVNDQESYVPLVARSVRANG